jgi:hypothetical protein
MNRQNEMLQLTWAEVEIAALCVGISSGTIRQWRHRGGIPARAQLRIIEHFGRPFLIANWPRRVNATLGRPSVAERASRFITAPTCCQAACRGDRPAGDVLNST